MNEVGVGCHWLIRYIIDKTVGIAEWHYTTDLSGGLLFTNYFHFSGDHSCCRRNNWVDACLSSSQIWNDVALNCEFVYKIIVLDVQSLQFDVIVCIL